MTEKQEIRAYALLSAALYGKFDENYEVNENHLLYNTEAIEPYIKELKGDKQINILSFLITSIMGKWFKEEHESSITNYFEKIKNLIENPDIKTINTFKL